MTTIIPGAPPTVAEARRMLRQTDDLIAEYRAKAREVRDSLAAMKPPRESDLTFTVIYRTTRKELATLRDFIHTLERRRATQENTLREAEKREKAGR